MGRRGGNLFKRNDALRAVKAARDSGIDPAVLEITTRDGTTYRVYGPDAAPATTTTDEAGADEWRQATEELKAKGKTKTR
jgi:hypothetical protein